MPAPMRIVGAVASICAGLIGVGASLRGGHAQAKVPEETVYLAMAPITEGEQITSSLVETFTVPNSAVSSSMLVASAQDPSPIGEYATMNIPQYSYLYQSQVSEKGTWENGIPPGQAAVDVTVNQASLAGVTAGESVALFGTMGHSGNTVELVPSAKILDLYTSGLQLIAAAPGSSSGGLFGSSSSATTTGTPSIVRFAVTPEEARQSIDSLSAMALLVHRVQQNGRCDGTASLYDGRRLMRLTARTVGTELVPRSSRSPYYGNAERCDFEGLLIGGIEHDKEEASTRRPKRGSAWFAVAAPGMPPLPIRMDFETIWFGTASMYLTNLRPRKAALAAGAAH